MGTGDWLYARVNRMYDDFGLDSFLNSSISRMMRDERTRADTAARRPERRE
jgi:hypothetical protein